MSKKKTHEEYTQQVAQINPNIEVAGQYINAKTKLLHICKIDQYQWYATPDHILRGQGCPLCSRSMKKTHNQYVSELLTKNRSIVALEQYVNGKTKILHKCLIDGYKWYAAPESTLMGTGCPVCAGKMVLVGVNDLLTTHPDVAKEWNYERNGELSPNQVSYGSHKKVWWKCRMCDYEWEALISSRSQGAGCPICGIKQNTKKRTKSHEQYIKEVEQINPNIIVVEKYINAKIPILHRCKIDGYEWYARPSNILKGRKCPKCEKHIHKTQERYVAEVSVINPDIIVIGQYVNINTKILHQCKIDNYKWEAKPTHILSGHGCPACNRSIGEKEIERYLCDHNIAFVPQYTFDDCRNVRPLPFDFYLPDYNMCIEYDGMQHFEPVEFFGGEESFEYRKANDEIKTQYCKKHNVTLLRINYKQNIYNELSKSLTMQD